MLGPVVGSARFHIFYNAAFGVESAYGIDPFWFELRKIEHQLGRVRAFHNGPRTMDLDILWSSLGARETKHTKLPHPQLTKRAFAFGKATEVANALRWKLPVNIDLAKSSQY